MQPEFQTQRLSVRRWQDADLSALFEVYGDADAMRWVGEGRALTHDECADWLSVTRRNYEQRGYGMFAVEERHAHAVIGFCGIVHPNAQPEPEVKYALRRSHWGRGLATEAVTGLIAYGARTHRLSFLIATAAPAHVASHRVLLKAGMQRGALRTNADGSHTQLFHWRAGEASGTAPSSGTRTDPVPSLLRGDISAAAQRSVLCWLATVDSQGQPNVSPKEIFAIFDEQHLVVAHIASPSTVRNLRHADKVCISFIDVFVQKGFKVLGHARNIAQTDPEFSRWAAPLIARAGPRFPIHSVIVIRASACEPILAPSYRLYPHDTTEPEQVASALRTYGVAPVKPRPEEDGA